MRGSTRDRDHRLRPRWKLFHAADRKRIAVLASREDREDLTGLIRVGADIERAVLARAVRWHCEDRVLRNDQTTVVF